MFSRGSRCITFRDDALTWLDSEAASYEGQVNLILCDPPWGVFQKRKDDQRVRYCLLWTRLIFTFDLVCCPSCIRSGISFVQIPPADVPRYAAHFHKLLSTDGNLLLRITVQMWHSWETALNDVGFNVVTTPLIILKDENSCAWTQRRWRGYTNGGYFYLLAHKDKDQFYWERDTTSGFLPKYSYPTTCNMINGTHTVRKKLCNEDGVQLRRQVHFWVCAAQTVIVSVHFVGNGHQWAPWIDP